MSGNQVRASLDEMMMACDVIEEHNCCTECPLEFNCVKTETYEDIWNKVSERRIDEFLYYADHIHEILEAEAEEEQRAYEEELAELQRGFDRDRL